MSDSNAPDEAKLYLPHKRMIARQRELIEKLKRDDVVLNSEEILEMDTFTDNVDKGFFNLVQAVDDVFRQLAKTTYSVSEALEEFDLAEAVSDQSKEE